MLSLAKAADEDDIKAAAEYFAPIEPKKLVDVMEAETVPKRTSTCSTRQILWHLPPYLATLER